MDVLNAIIEPEESVFHVLSPAVGICSEFPKEGTIITGGSVIGRIKILKRSFDLILPKGVSGKIEIV